jgi:hypothetical protein
MGTVTLDDARWDFLRSSLARQDDRSSLQRLPPLTYYCGHPEKTTKKLAGQNEASKTSSSEPRPAGRSAWAVTVKRILPTAGLAVVPGPRLIAKVYLVSPLICPKCHEPMKICDRSPEAMLFGKAFLVDSLELINN